jgi:hypothetical protein
MSRPPGITSESRGKTTLAGFTKATYEVFSADPVNRRRVAERLFSSEEDLKIEIRKHGPGYYTVYRVEVGGESTTIGMYTLGLDGAMKFENWSGDNDKADG